MTATAVPLRPVSKGGLAVLWIGLALLVAGAVAWALFVSNPAQVRIVTLEAGDGRVPQEGEFAVIKYEGRLADGTVFDANDEAPFPIQEGATIPGFDQAMRQLRMGGRYRVYIPASLGYGAEGRGPIPANADLVFDVELLDIKTEEEIQQMMMLRQMMQQQQGGGAGGPPGPGGPAGGPPGGPPGGGQR
jgi:FKBP-type peptidyl-prolyl cis-trans isomerase FkpA